MSGNYQPAHGAAVAWSIDDHHNLVWGGQPYVPVGLHINGTVDEISAAKKSGINDVIVDLPPNGVGWADALNALERGGMRYILSVDSLLPPAKGFSIEPGAYRVDKIESDRHVSISLPGAVSALAVLVTQRDASVQTYARVPVVDGKFEYDVKAKTDLDEILLVYPEHVVATHPDFWDGFDGQRDLLLAAIQQNRPGSGLRGILNPLGRMFSTDVTAGLFVPESAFFRNELAAYLEGKYRNVQTAVRAWDIGTNDIDTFAAMAKLVPLWSGPRGVGEVWNTTTDELFLCNQRSSQIWTDIRNVMAAAAAKRFERLVPAVQSVADVPVLQDWIGWTAPFEATTPELTGVGYSASGTNEQDILNSASRPTSSVLRWSKPGWIVCTDLDLQRDADGGPHFGELINHLESMGSRGWFLKEATSDQISAAAADAPPRAANLNAASVSTTPVYFPENAFNPVFPKQITASGKWWLPAPEDGNRIDYGAGFYGYQYIEGNGYVSVLWTTDKPGIVKLDMISGKTSSFTRMDGAEVKPLIKKDVVEVPMDETPLIVTNTGEIPVPEPCILQTTAQFSQLLAFGDHFHADISEDAFFFKDALTNYKKDPSSSFIAMRKRFVALNVRVGKFSWIEGESSRDTNFSEIVPISGCSGGAVLLLHTPVTTDPKGFYANYEVPVRSMDDQEVWIAARIPQESIRDVSVQVANQELNITEGPVSPYGAGFAWYKLGTTKMGGSGTRATFRVNSPAGAYIALDAILIAPGHFVPNGIIPPDAIPYSTPTIQRKGKRG
jgi:hypothetical protein